MWKSKILTIATLIALILGFVALDHAAAKKKKVFVPGYLGKAVEMEVIVEGLVSEMGELPTLLPSRLRVVIQPNKGEVCFQCHKIPYPTAPTEPPQSWQTKLSPILTTPPAGWRLLTPTEGPFQYMAGGWSPDGKRILYSLRLSEKNWDIWVKDIDAKTGIPLVTGPSIDLAPDWSPDGKSILFQSNRTGSNDIWMMEIASKKLIQLTDDPGEETRPIWTPDGKRIIFQSNRAVKLRYLADGSGHRRMDSVDKRSGQG